MLLCVLSCSILEAHKAHRSRVEHFLYPHTVHSSPEGVTTISLFPLSAFIKTQLVMTGHNLTSQHLMYLLYVTAFDRHTPTSLSTSPVMFQMEIDVVLHNRNVAML